MTFCLAAIGVVAVGAVLRWQASRDDFWLDEIWSWLFAIDAKSYWQIATQIKHENNHIFNTWVIYSLPPDADWFWYRLPAVLAGVGTVVLAGLSGLQRSRCEGLTALVLTSGSFVLIQYASEARGYAYLLFFTLLCVWLLQRVTAFSRTLDVWLFGVFASFGLLTHLLFLGAYGGLIAWTLIIAMRTRRDWFARLRFLLSLHLLPGLMVLSLVLIGRPVPGGGEINKLADVVLQAGSLSLGGPYAGRLAVACCGVAVLVSIWGLMLLVRVKDGMVYFVAGSTGTLALMIVIANPDSIYMRHFVVPVLCVLLMLSHVLAQLWGRGPKGRALYTAILIAFLAANTTHIWRLLATGRGGYQAALDFMRENSRQPNMTVGSDHDFRNPLLLSYFHAHSKNSRPLEYFPRGKWPMDGPEWLIRHSFDQPPATPLPMINDGANIRFKLVRVYPYSGLSGWNWMLYHRADLERQSERGN